MGSLAEDLAFIVREKMSPLNGTAHSYEHVCRVLKIATFLAEREGADVELVQVGALLHEVGRVIGEPHNETGARLAHEILKDMNYSLEKREKAARIVMCHPIDFKDRLETAEEKIVWDADKIDLLGAAGLARGFHWCGEKPFDVAVQLASKVYTPIYGMLNTLTAREVAKKRYEETMSFLSALEKELALTDLALH